MRYEVNSSGVPVLLLDSISEILPEDTNKIVVAGSHCSQNVPRYALSVPLRGAVFNDAGVGKDQAGVASFGILSNGGVPAVAVSHNTARIGDAQDVYANGIISTANELATDLGAEPGMTVADYIALVDATR
ncbi:MULTISPECIES: hypothetical protein [unclassified Rhodococcus (in: high G+C Gram-positive bacteria)]|uniref:hypothetical protein n=1 Tax=unclassified Rhodococcus (in: high G+C Gram-positive bacteria) TaxID=192944 RepID=UPI0016398519|nr:MULTISPECIES: hypothetical protein [unclassified Rhodococcus (in: high G+C Gram-positive bacteria)]MBC2638190.1 hypothetical protein [Rhodococcus sp. 3A]MBC2897067.1 hypothetical protein [Rhodococcus sp. 4CII]